MNNDIPIEDLLFYKKIAKVCPGCEVYEIVK